MTAPEIPLDEVLQFMGLIWAIDPEMERVSKRMEATVGLTIPQRLSLLLIGRNPGILASELASVLHLHRGTLSGVIRRLEAAGPFIVCGHRGGMKLMRPVAPSLPRISRTPPGAARAGSAACRCPDG